MNVFRTLCALAMAGGIILALISVTNSAAATGHAEGYRKSYSLIKTLGSDRTGPGEFSAPAGLATDADGNLYVVDSGSNQRVQKFSSNGMLLAMWSIPDAEEYSLVGIDIDSNGNMYVVDFQGFAIWTLSVDDASVVREFGQPALGRGLRSPFGIAVDPATNEVYVTAASEGIRKYSSNGTLVTQFKDNHENDPRVKLYHTTGVDIDSGGNVYVLAADNPLEDANIVQIFSSNGTFIGSWGSERLKHPNDIAIDSTDTVFIRDSDSKIKVFTSDGTFLTEWGSVGIGKEQISGSVGIAFDPKDDTVVYLSDPGNSRVQKYTKDGTYISSIGLASTAEGQFQAPYDIEFDSQGNMYVADLQNHRIQKFASNGTFITMLGSQCELEGRLGGELCIDPDGPDGPRELGDGQFSSPIDIAIDSQDNVYVLDSWGNMRIQKFTSDGDFVLKFKARTDNRTSDETSLVGIVGIAVDSEDKVYAAVSGASPSIQKFTGSGNFIEGWNLHGPKIRPPPPPPDLLILDGTTPEEYAATRMSIPWLIEIDSSDNVYVYGRVDTVWENYHIEKMSSNGALLASWGQAGWCKEEFRDIRGMAFDSEDNVYLLDSSNDRIAKFDSEGKFVTLYYPEDFHGINSLRLNVNAIAFDFADNLYLATENTVSVFAPTDLTVKPPPAYGLDAGDLTESPAKSKYYGVSTRISQDSRTFVLASSSDVRLVCGLIDVDEKAVRFELLNRSYRDAIETNRIELILPDEYVSGIYQVRSDNGQELPFEAKQLDEGDRSLLAAHELAANSDYTAVTFVIPENASFIDIYAAEVIPEFYDSAISIIIAASIVGIAIGTRMKMVMGRKQFG